jgi:hypothetical protein
MMNLRPEHLPKGCETNAGKCAHVDKEGRVCGLYADMHRVVRRRPGRKQYPNKTALLNKLELKIRLTILREIDEETPKKKKDEVKCECDSSKGEHDAEWPHGRGVDCKGFIPKMWKMPILVSCLGCRFQYDDIGVFTQHTDVSAHPEMWGACKHWKKDVVCCVRCRRVFFYKWKFNSHAECKKYQTKTVGETDVDSG